MPKSQYVDPKIVLRKGKIQFCEIAENAYDKTVAQEFGAGAYSRDELLGIYSDMVVIRAFETMLRDTKLKGNHIGRKYAYVGASHLSIGEEASAVGMAYLLDENDFLFGTHRSHHEAIAKGLCAIRKMSEGALREVMEQTGGGRQLALIRKYTDSAPVQVLAERFFLYGVISELFAKSTGFSRGFGGSMHLQFLQFGVYPCNAIVGGSAPIAAGAALFKRVNKTGGVVVASVGDGATGKGSVYEAMNFSAMDQYAKLWGEAGQESLPIVFHINNNSYAMGGQTDGETMCFGAAARLGAIARNQMHAERIDGMNPLAVIDAYRRKLPLAREEKGPVLLECMNYRFSGHSATNVNFTYRTGEEVADWEQYDPLVTFPKSLIEAGICTQAEAEAVRDAAVKRNDELFLLASDSEISPYHDFERDPALLERLMFSEKRVSRMREDPCSALLEKGDNPRLERIAKKERYAFDEKGSAVSKLRCFNVRDALFEAIYDKMYVDPTLITYGEDVRDWGGGFGVYDGLTEAFPYQRVFSTPISESTIVGSAVGYAMAGGRVVAEIMYADFLTSAGDEIINQLAKWQALTAGAVKLPVVIRVPCGAKYGAQHSQELTSLFCHVPGLKVVYPVTPYDAKGMLNTALMGTDPVLFFESQMIYDMGERFYREGVPKEYYEVPFGAPAIRREGKDLTILTVGTPLYRAIEAAKTLENYGAFAEVIDARSLVPFGYETLAKSVQKTGRLLLIGDGVTRGNYLNDIAANITQMVFSYLKAPPFVLGASNTIMTAAEYEAFYYPQSDGILDAVHERLLPLRGYAPKGRFSPEDFLSKSNAGV